MLNIDLNNKKVFIAGIGDDQGFGWAIAKTMAEAGAEILVGTWVPVFQIFKQSWERGKFNESRVLSDGSLMQIAKIYPIDAAFDSPEAIPDSIKTNKRYQNVKAYSVSEVAEAVSQDFGSIDYLVHSLAYGSEIKNPLLATSRKGYLEAVGASSYSFVSLLQHFGPLMPQQGAALSLTYLASSRVIPGYGGGMSSAKAALESDTRTLAWEAGRKWKVRVNTISAGPLPSRAARAIGFIEQMIEYGKRGAPLTEPLQAKQVGTTAAFLLSDLASAITGVTLYVDNGMHVMGVGPEISEASC